MLGYRDSGMADTEPNNHPDCFHQADIDEAIGRLVAIIRRTRPQVIITYGDDQAGYPHPDHLRVHDISVLAFERAGDPDWYPELGEPFTPSKLYYSVWSKARVDRRARGDPRTAPASRRSRRSGSTVRRRTIASRPRSTSATSSGLASESLRAHATQVDPTAAWWFGLDDDEHGRGLPVGGLDPRPFARRADPGVDDERDLFAGVRERVSTHDASSTGWSSARRTSASTAPTMPTSWSPCRSVDAAARRLRPDGRVHAWRAEGDRPHRSRCSTC